MSFLKHSADFQGVVDICMNDAKRYLPFTQLMAGIMSGPSSLEHNQREMVALHVSTLNHCPYCVGSHRAVLAELGVSEHIIAGAEAGAIDDIKLDPVLRFAGKLTREPGAIQPADIEPMRQAGWSEQAIEDVINIVSLFSYLNRLVDGFGVTGSPKAFDQAATMIASSGYQPVAQMLAQKAASVS